MTSATHQAPYAFSVRMYTMIYIYIYIYIYACIDVHMNACLYVYVRMHAYINACRFDMKNMLMASASKPIHVYVHTCTRLCAYTLVHLAVSHTHIHTYKYTHTHMPR